ncbi:hypothetical protein SOVF_140360 [Spinacia oleracea]|nr:hypothetical protein SOVF_140360 [Spinacia oleracea]
MTTYSLIRFSVRFYSLQISGSISYIYSSFAGAAIPAQEQAFLFNHCLWRYFVYR